MRRASSTECMCLEIFNACTGSVLLIWVYCVCAQEHALFARPLSCHAVDQSITRSLTDQSSYELSGR
jgi:hypothetical protein